MTIQELQLLNLGYLKGNNLMQFCPPQLLIKQDEIIKDIIQTGTNIAYEEIKSKLSNRYDIDAEFALTTGKNSLLVKLTSILAIKNILGNNANISEFLNSLITWAEKEILSIQNRQTNINILVANEVINSGVEVVGNSFKTIG